MGEGRSYSRAMTLCSLVLAALITIGVSESAAAQTQAQVQTASAATIDWVARACTPETAFGLRFGERADDPGHRVLDDALQPFTGLSFRSTERSRRVFLVETTGMFRLAPGSTQSDPVAGRQLFEAVDARIRELGTFSSRESVIDEDGDIDITYSRPTARPESRVVLEVAFMLGGVWMTCRDLELVDLQFREVFQ